MYIQISISIDYHSQIIIQGKRMCPEKMEVYVKFSKISIILSKCGKVTEPEWREGEKFHRKRHLETRFSSFLYHQWWMNFNKMQNFRVIWWRSWAQWFPPKSGPSQQPTKIVPKTKKKTELEKKNQFSFLFLLHDEILDQNVTWNQNWNYNTERVICISFLSLSFSKILTHQIESFPLLFSIHQSLTQMRTSFRKELTLFFKFLR